MAFEDRSSNGQGAEADHGPSPSMILRFLPRFCGNSIEMCALRLANKGVYEHLISYAPMLSIDEIATHFRDAINIRHNVTLSPKHHDVFVRKERVGVNSLGEPLYRYYGPLAPISSSDELPDTLFIDVYDVDDRSSPAMTFARRDTDYPVRLHVKAELAPEQATPIGQVAPGVVMDFSVPIATQQCISAFRRKLPKMLADFAGYTETEDTSIRVFFKRQRASPSECKKVHFEHEIVDCIKSDKTLQVQYMLKDRLVKHDSKEIPSLDSDVKDSSISRNESLPSAKDQTQSNKDDAKTITSTSDSLARLIEAKDKLFNSSLDTNATLDGDQSTADPATPSDPSEIRRKVQGELLGDENSKGRETNPKGRETVNFSVAPRLSAKDFALSNEIRTKIDALAALKRKYTNTEVNQNEVEEKKDPSQATQGACEDGACSKGASKPETGSGSEAGAGEKTIHNASCNTCDEVIIGDRFKCLTCPDYDCCESCEPFMPEIHPNHRFVVLHEARAIPCGVMPLDWARHPNVICDDCNVYILGPRFKCMVCPDFDLCAACEANPLQKHVEVDKDMPHYFIKIDKPVPGVAKITNHAYLVASQQKVQQAQETAQRAQESANETKKDDAAQGPKEFEHVNEPSTEVASFKKNERPMSEAERNTAARQRTEKALTASGGASLATQPLEVNIETTTVTSTLDQEPVEDFDMTLVTDKNFPDGNKIAAGAQFVKLWSIKNTGRKCWPLGTTLACVCSTADNAPVQPVYLARSVMPGDNYIVGSPYLRAPERLGMWNIYFRLRRPLNPGDPHSATQSFGQQLWCALEVVRDPSSSTSLAEQEQDTSEWDMSALSKSLTQQNLDASDGAPAASAPTGKMQKEGKDSIIEEDAEVESLSYILQPYAEGQKLNASDFGDDADEITDVLGIEALQDPEGFLFNYCVEFIECCGTNEPIPKPVRDFSRRMRQIKAAKKAEAHSNIASLLYRADQPMSVEIGREMLSAKRTPSGNGSRQSGPSPRGPCSRESTSEPDWDFNNNVIDDISSNAGSDFEMVAPSTADESEQDDLYSAAVSS